MKYLLLSLMVLCNITPAMAGWEVQWIDTFSGTGVNWDNWTAQTQANYNNEVQCYTDDDSSANKNYDVSNGTLKIIARKENVSCSGLGGQSKSWTSGRLNSKDKKEFQFGRIESRIKFHNLEGGTWPAFWMLENRIAEQPRKNDDDFIHWPNPGAGEIDVWEWFSNQPHTYITNFFNTHGCGSEVRYTYPGGSSDVLEWQRYAIEWDEDNISFYINDQKVVTQNVSNCPQYKEPMFILLNLAMGGNLGGTIDPSLNLATLEVDYVAHCTATSANDFAYCNESNVSDGDDDQDGVSNANDLCPDTAIGETVDAAGCSIVQEVNVAPIVTLSISQDGVNTSQINTANGEVTVTATVTDENNDDTIALSWNVSALNNHLINNEIITFDPSEMAAGQYSIRVNVSDDGAPMLTDAMTLFFVINQSTVNNPPVAQVSGPSESITSGDRVTLSAETSTDVDEDSLTYLWLQTAGPTVELSNNTSGELTFEAPEVDENATVAFEVEVSDGLLSDRANIDIVVSAKADPIAIDNDTVSTSSSGGGSSGIFLLFLMLVFFKKAQRIYP